MNFNITHNKQHYIFRLATKDDASQIRTLVNQAYKELADMGLNYTAATQDEATTLERMTKGRTFVLIHNKQVVGTILFYEENHFTKKKSAYLGQFAISPELKRSGLGSIVMDFCEQLANDEKYESIQLDTAKPAKHLVEWYQRRGYKVVGEMHWEGKTYDSYIFEKTLRAAFSKKK
jgi:ribosomal protein S18 acetylase RimI-like enzyme